MSELLAGTGFHSGQGVAASALQPGMLQAMCIHAVHIAAVF